MIRVDIKKLLKDDNFIIVLDTNVLLNIYRYSAEFSEFALNCLRAVKRYVVLPATVRLEYEKHYKAEFVKMRERVENASQETSKQIQIAKKKILKTCDNLERLQFSDIGVLRAGLAQKIDALEKFFNDFFCERNSLNLISHFWEDNDYLMDIVKEWDRSNRIMLSPSQEDIYYWCEEGEKRYKNEIPPGFKDIKNKDGVRKYSDLILWKEILRFAKKEEKNVVFVTDDVKSDWWKTVGDNRELHQKLIDEFENTGQKLFPFISREFYNEIATAFNIEKTDAVEIALCMTDSDYCIKIADKVFEEVWDKLTYNIADYVSHSHIGSDGIDELEAIEYKFLSAERMDRYDDIVTYQFQFEVKAEGTSYEYWGRDDDTKEVIRSYGTNHVFEGVITIEVTRETNIYLDFEDDSDFKTAEIIYSDLKETKYDERCVEEIPNPGDLGFCQECSCPLNVYNNGGDGFCVRCSYNH